MIRALREWADDRLGLSATIHDALYERIPSGARWRYITGSMLVFAFVTQAVTGIFLWMAYSPSSQTAYESVWYIQHQMTGGWLVRGVHHFMAQAMVVVMALHMLQVVLGRGVSQAAGGELLAGLGADATGAGPGAHGLSAALGSERDTGRRTWPPTWRRWCRSWARIFSNWRSVATNMATTRLLGSSPCTPACCRHFW